MILALLLIEPPHPSLIELELELELKLYSHPLDTCIIPILPFPFPFPLPYIEPYRCSGMNGFGLLYDSHLSCHVLIFYLGYSD